MQEEAHFDHWKGESRFSGTASAEAWVDYSVLSEFVWTHLFVWKK